MLIEFLSVMAQLQEIYSAFPGLLNCAAIALSGVVLYFLVIAIAVRVAK
jgi:hypothetical protein